MIMMLSSPLASQAVTHLDKQPAAPGSKAALLELQLNKKLRSSILISKNLMKKSHGFADDQQ